MKLFSFGTIFMLVAILFSVHCAQGIAPDQVCGENEEYTSCGSSCPETCESSIAPNKAPCTMQCVPGCFCKASYVRDTANGNRCVQQFDCKQHRMQDAVGPAVPFAGSEKGAAFTSTRITLPWILAFGLAAVIIARRI